jgi:hypothetical protein
MISLRKQRMNAFQQLDRITTRRRNLLARWLERAMRCRSESGTYHGMTKEETSELDLTLRDIKAFSAVSDEEDPIAKGDWV